MLWLERSFGPRVESVVTVVSLRALGWGGDPALQPQGAAWGGTHIAGGSVLLQTQTQHLWPSN